jgi:uncharacterized membrane protein (UPF0182 family)
MVTRIPTARSGRRRLLLVVVAVLAGLLLAFTALSGFFIDVLWFREVGFEQVFWTVLRTKVVLGLVFGILFFLLLYANLWIVRRITPRYRPLTPEQEIVERYRLQFEPYARWILPAFAAVIAIFVGLGVTTQWRTFLLWRNSSGILFGAEEPLFDRDAAFYVFSLPWLRFVQGWLFSALVGVLIICALAHYLWGGIRPNAPGIGEKVTPQVKAHLSVLLGLIMLTKAWGYYLGQFDLLQSTRGVVFGASYTDVNAQLPALRILIFIAIVCAVLFLVNIRLRGWALPVIAVGLLALVSILAGAGYPAFVQRFRVAPQELQRERPYIQYNIDATQYAFGLDGIDATPVTQGDGSVSADDVEANDATISNIRLWRPDILNSNYTSLQRFRAYYAFNDIDVDRYVLNGQRRVVMFSAREVSQAEIPEGGRTWQNTHLVYTHGFGAVASQVNTATTEGQPVFSLRDIPPTGEPLLEGNGQRVYYGEGAAGNASFVVVNSDAEELDYQGTGTDDQRFVAAPQYEGTGGIPIGGLFQRALFAWRFRDVNLLISDLILGESRIMVYRDIAERVPKAAPFLQFDADPYAAVVDGRLVWIWDAYTTTDQFPYSEPVDLSQVTSGSAQEGAPTPTGMANYVRNSVKVVVDAYDGSMVFYTRDEGDPIVEVWRRAFPELFTDFEEASPDLLAHFRYPENLFQIQAERYTSYHVTEPQVFYGQQDFWALPADPTVGATAEGAQPAMRPYYVLMKLPGEAAESFVLILPFTPQGRQNMVAWMAAKSDPGEGYGDIVSFEFPAGLNVDGPTQVFARINQDARFSAERTLLGQGGSSVRFGDFLVIPVEDSLLYVQPVYVESNQPNAIPELRRVVVVNGEQIGLGNNLTEALSDSIGEQVEPPPDGEEPPPTGTVDEQVAALLEEAEQHFVAAEVALRDGDLATYQSETEQAQAAIEDALALLGAEPEPTASPSPGESPSPSPSG